MTPVRLTSSNPKTVIAMLIAFSASTISHFELLKPLPVQFKDSTLFNMAFFSFFFFLWCNSDDVLSYIMNDKSLIKVQNGFNIQTLMTLQEVLHHLVGCKSDNIRLLLGATST